MRSLETIHGSLPNVDRQEIIGGRAPTDGGRRDGPKGLDPRILASGLTLFDRAMMTQYPSPDRRVIERMSGVEAVLHKLSELIAFGIAP